MPRKPKGLGYVAHQNLAAADAHLAASDRLLEPQSRGEKVSYELVASKSRFWISEARRLLEKTIALPRADEPDESGKG